MHRRALTMPMIRALRQIRSEPGRDWTEYRALEQRTVLALKRRDLIHVFVNGQLEPTDAGREIHLHEFHTTMHMDGCHWYSTVATCECGAVYQHYGERSLKDDPYSAIWMDERDEAGNDVPCQRCEDLKDGARPIFREGITLPRRARAAA